MEELQKMRNKSPDFQVTYDLIHNTSVQNISRKKLFSTEEPLMLLYKHIQEKNLRLVDLFNIFDEDNSMTLDRDEFTKGMMVLLCYIFILIRRLFHI